MRLEYVAREPLRKGMLGTEQLLERVTREIRAGAKDAEIRELARRVVTNTPPQNTTRQIQAVWDYVTRLPYLMDPVELQLIPRAADIPKLGAADCKKYTVLAGALLESIGHPVKVRVIDQRPQLADRSPDFHHVYLRVFNKDRGRWQTFDPVAKSWRNPKANVGTELHHQARRTYMLRRADGGMGAWYDLPAWLDPTRSENTALRSVIGLAPGGSAALVAADAFAQAKKAMAPAKPPAALAKPPPPAAPPTPGSDKKMSTGAKVAIIGGSVAGAALLVTVIVVATRRKKNPRRRRHRKAA